MVRPLKTYLGNVVGEMGRPPQFGQLPFLKSKYTP